MASILWLFGSSRMKALFILNNLIIPEFFKGCQEDGLAKRELPKIVRSLAQIGNELS